MSTCADCGRERKIRARGMCGSCYQINLRDGNHLKFESVYKPRERPCAACGETRQIQGRDLCERCYDRARHNRLQAEADRIAAEALVRARHGICLYTNCRRTATPGCHPNFRFCPQHLDQAHRLITTDTHSDHLPDDWTPTPGTRAWVPGTGLREKVSNP